MCRSVPALALVAALAPVGACGEGFVSGASEPVRVREGTFHVGELPVDQDRESPAIINAAGAASIVVQGQGSIEYAGLASKDAYAVAVAFPTAGTGFWVVPVLGPDVTQDDNLIFQFTADFDEQVPFGLQTLSFVALDDRGEPGPRYDAQVCILPEAANGSLAACDPAVAPQAAVLSLTWDTDSDMDLIVITPDGKVVSSKAPTTVLQEGIDAIPSEALNDPATGTLTRDSNANCDIDGLRLESLVFPGAPPEGEYRVYANLHAACGESHATWRLALHERVEGEDGEQPVEHTDLAAGTLLPFQAAQGTKLGTLVTTVSLP